MNRTKSVNFIHFLSIDSTNTWAKNNADILDPNYITCITAQEQTAGKGRFFRKWISPKGQNIYASLFFKVPLSAPFIANLGQVMCISCSKVLKKIGFEPQIKWPNDLLLSGKKIAGVLCESITMDDKLGIILGFGVNVNMSKDILRTIDQPATSLVEESGHTWNLEEILEKIVYQFIEDYTTLESQGFEVFHKVYESLLAYKGQLMAWSDGIKQINGICHSISPEGKLNLITHSGEMISLFTGEIKAF